jgi:hypothetical protein
VATIRELRCHRLILCVTFAIMPNELQPSQNAGSLQGRAKTQVALRDGLPVGLRPRLAEFTTAN